MVVSSNPTVKLTYEDYRKTPEDERYELICQVRCQGVLADRPRQPDSAGHAP